ncbi:MAG: hypothetical protein LDL30_13890, partial [Desulfovibrio sp.]|nr:hypothetical protein [Desulfovibrio sp.]
ALVARRERLQERQAAAQDLQTPPMLEETARPAALVRQWRALSRQQGAATTRAEVLTGTQAPPVLEPVTPLAAMVETLARLQALRARAVQRMQAAEAALATQREVIATRLESIGHCPTCGQGLSRATLGEFLEGGHAH